MPEPLGILLVLFLVMLLIGWIVLAPKQGARTSWVSHPLPIDRALQRAERFDQSRPA
jgi:hypothetical protein